MQKMMNWCLIGTGTLAKNVAEEILPSGRHRIVSTFSRNWDNNRAFAERFGAEPCRTAKEAILHPSVDAVYVVTPHPSHFANVMLALECGKPVLCEKPFMLNAAQAREAIALAKEKQLYLAEAMWTWFAPTAHQVKTWLDAGEFGKLTRVTANYCQDSKGYAPRVTDPNLAGGALLDVGVYPIYYLCSLFGKPEVVSASGKLSDGIDWGETVTFRFANGLVVESKISIDDPVTGELVELVGSKASVSIPNFHGANGATLRRADGTEERFTGYGGMLNEFDRAAEEILAGRTESAYTPHAVSIDVMDTVDTCRRLLGLVYPFEKK